MNCRRISLLLACTLAVVAKANAAPTTEDQVKALGQRYNQVEEQLSRSVVYAKKEEQAGGETIVQRAWFNGTGDLLKVSTDRSGPAARELTEYVASGSELSCDALFVLTRKETTAPEGGTQVEEARKYYGEVWSRNADGGDKLDYYGVLLRELRKSAHFGPGETLDTSKTPNVAVKMPKAPKSAQSDAEGQEARKFFEVPQQLATELREAGPPEADPTAGVMGDSDRYRLIHGSVSPDGRYALAFGFEQAPDWDTYKDEDVEGEEVFTADDVDHIQNYVVELATRRILGKTGGQYFGTRRSYNHRAYSVSWSADSLTFVALQDDKWNYVSCHAGRIAPGPKLIGVADLGTAAEKHAISFLKARRRYNEDANIALSIEEVKPNGTVEAEIIGQAASGERKGDVYFTVEETLRLQTKSGGLGVSVSSTRLMPNE